MVTVWIFFGSAGGDGRGRGNGGVATVLTGRLGGTGAVATGGATAGAGGQFGLVAIAVMVATTDGGKGGLSREVTGIVETTRGAVFASSMLIGSSPARPNQRYS